MVLAGLLALSCCTACAETKQKFSHYFFGTFDTIITLIGYADSEEEFGRYAALAEAEMQRYHRIFDRYNAYEGVNNLYAVNHLAPNGATPAEPELIELLLKIREWHKAYGTKANPAMGSVLELWHYARNAGTYLPSDEQLKAAAGHTDYEDVLINAEEMTIAFADPGLSIDLGAVAKGYAAQLTADKLHSEGFHSFILNAGGNVVCGGAPEDGRSQWTVAIEDTDGTSTRLIIGAINQSIVTSGDYQRYFEVDGKRYHHLIDPVTLYPSTHLRAVTVVHPDSGLADFLSTTLFLLPYEEGLQLVESIPEAEALWTLSDETVWMSSGFQALVDRVN